MEAFGDLYNEWSLALEDKHLRIGPNRIEGFLAGPSSGDLRADVNLTLNEWHHVAYVFDGQKEMIYVNGHQEALRNTGNANSIMNYPRPGEANPRFNQGYTGLGAYRRDSVITDSFQGYVESLRVSSVARYSGMTFTPVFGDFALDNETVLLFKFDESPGSTLISSFGSHAITGQLGETLNEQGAPRNAGSPELVSRPNPPSAGDFNADGVLDDGDIELLSDGVRRAMMVPQLDLNGDGAVSGEDRRVWVEELRRTYFGDSTLDGEFSSSDLIHVFRRGEYEDGIIGNSTWRDGDWDGDSEFDSGDLVVAFQGNGYEMGPRAALLVPEPTLPCTALIAVGVIIWIQLRSSPK